MRVIIALCLLVVLANSCQANHEAHVREVVSTYFDSMLHQDYETAYEQFSSEDHEAISLEEFESWTDEGREALAGLFADSVKYEVTSVEIEGSFASANVEVTEPDFGSMLADAFGSAFAAALAGEGEDEIRKAIAEKYKDKPLPLMTTQEKMELRREDDGWKIYGKWQAAKEETDRLTRQTELCKEASDLEEKQELKAALAKYLEASDLSPDDDSINSHIAELEVAIELQETKHRYIRSIEIYDVQAEYHMNYSGQREAGLTFKLKNKSDRAFSKVEVTATFQDQSGKDIFEMVGCPVWVSDYSFSRESNRPLKPGFIWQMDSGWYYIVTGMPDEWKEGSVRAMVTDIEFLD